MPAETLSTESLAVIALRAALRAQPTFRLNEVALRSSPANDPREILAAMHVCAWSGLGVFSASDDRDRMLSAIRGARSIASKWHFSERPEVAAAAAAEVYLLRSPSLRPDLDTLVSSTRTLEPAKFATAALSAIDADVAACSEDAKPATFVKRPLWPADVPPMWEGLLDEYASYLGQHGLADLGAAYRDMIQQVSGGQFDRVTPNVVFRRWFEEPAELTQKAIDLTAYSFSFRVQQVMASAVDRLRARRREALSSRAVLLEIAESGQSTIDRQWIGDFIRKAVAQFPEQYSAALRDTGFSANRARVDPNSPAMREQMSSVPTMPGLGWALERARTLARETTTDDKIAGRHLFAALILDPDPPHELGSMTVLTGLGLNIPLLRQRLYEWVRGYGDDDAAWHRALIGTAVIPRRRAGFDADGTTGPDFLDIDQDVLALATLIAARESSPPLSIGLFGDWGSGKTFFMNRLRRTVADLSAEARAARVMQRDHWFYKRIVQIEFNAWHYVEGNLWASMVEHILSNLRFSDEPEPTVTQTLQNHLIDKLGFATDAASETEKKQQDAATKVTAAEAAVAVAKMEHDNKQKELQALSAESIKRDFQLGGVTDAIVEALKPLGIVPAGDAVAEMESSLRLARSVVERGHAGMIALVRAEDRTNRLRSLLILLFGAGAATGLITYAISLMTKPQIALVSSTVTAVAGAVAGVAQWIRKQAEWLAAQQDKVEEAQRKYDEALKAKLAEHTAKVISKQQELALAQQDYLVAQQSAERARREREAAIAELAAATTPRLLGRFIQDRAASTDYRKYLGVLAVVRQDFQQLSRLIEEDNWRLAPLNPAEDKRYEGRLTKVQDLDEENRENGTRINRIVLYIDDLDRCPPAKVVEVLQAVHLLLAFPLFVVVVGVDARWISRSLESRYRELLRVGDRDTAGDIAEMFGVARSEDYLEKIFQIPLWLRRMDANDARRMVQGMLRASAPPPKKEEAKPDPPAPKPDATPAPVTPAAPPTGAAPSPPMGSPPPRPPDTGKPGGDADRLAEHKEPRLPAAAAVNPESLTVRDFEVDVIDSLLSLLGRSPRALKRFVNLYRLIKAGLTPTEHEVFIRRSIEALDDYEAVLFLLAVDTGLPRASTAMFDVLLAVNRNGAGVTADDFVARLGAHPAAASPESATLAAWIEDHKGSRWFRGDAVRQLSNWVPRVMRHSFQAAGTGDNQSQRHERALPNESQRPAERTPKSRVRGPKPASRQTDRSATRGSD